MSSWILVTLKDGRRALVDPARIVSLKPLMGDEAPAPGPSADEGPGYTILDNPITDPKGDS